jgi:osmotically-inducible protein OsmY
MKSLLLCVFLVAANLGSASALEDPAPRQPPPAHVKTDDEIKTTVVKGILANPVVFAARLRVEVDRGFVTLRGTVQNQAAKAIAEKIARAVPGVRAVKNRLAINSAKR